MTIMDWMTALSPLTIQIGDRISVNRSPNRLKHKFGQFQAVAWVWLHSPRRLPKTTLLNQPPLTVTITCKKNRLS